MTGPVLIDTNILVLLAVGTASRTYTADHKNTKNDFTVADFELVGLIIAEFSEIVLVPHVVAETSSLVRQIGNPKRAKIQRTLADWVSLVLEVPIASLEGISREEHLDLGITDAILLRLCGMTLGDHPPTLLTIDQPLANRAASLGYSVIDYRREWQAA